LQEEVTALHTSIKQKDDSYNKMMMTRISLQTEINILNRKNTEAQEEKAELIQQKKQLQEEVTPAHKKLQEEVTALHKSIKEKDDSYNKVMMTRISLQT
jgi:peptidoglycan hydrolase CwlO-like protein